MMRKLEINKELTAVPKKNMIENEFATSQRFHIIWLLKDSVPNIVIKLYLK